MPKIIVNAKQKLIDEARKQAIEFGYESLNIRTVAKNCGMSVGTVYNYFPSKDALVAEFLTSDWNEHLREFSNAAENGASIRSVTESAYRELRDFQKRYKGLFRSLSPKQINTKKNYHMAMRDQLSECFLVYCKDAFTARFIAGAIINGAFEGTSIRKLSAIVEKIVA